MAGSARRTLAEKIWDAHVVRSAEGDPDLLYIDLHLIHEVTSPQPVEGLRAGHLVDQVEVDIEQVGLAFRAAHHVGIPDFPGERSVRTSGHHAPSLPLASRIPRRQYSEHEQL